MLKKSSYLLTPNCGCSIMYFLSTLLGGDS
jgi:hypothetical protein